jgi:hypothetical protein
VADGAPKKAGAKFLSRIRGVAGAAPGLCSRVASISESGSAQTPKESAVVEEFVKETGGIVKTRRK